VGPQEAGRVRLVRALELTRKSALPLKAIALQCSYGSVQHMTSVFHQCLGKTPAAIRSSRE
jgi:transcriptional regulator GlxA family with amidase domain